MIPADHPAFDAAVQFADYVGAQQAAIFVGAGLSCVAGYPDWKAMLAPVAASLGVDIHAVTDFPALAQYFVNESAGNKALLENQIAMQLRNPPRLQAVHRALSMLPIATIWTTNYDSVLESAYADVRPDIKVGDRSLLSGVVSHRVTIYKMHGTVTPHPSDIVITQDDYEHYFLRYPLMCRQLTSDLATKTFLFVGVSFTDANVRHNVAQLRALLRGSTRTHFLVYKIPSRESTRQHQLWLKDLARYGILGLPLNDYSELPELLALIRNRSLPLAVLVSGSHDGSDYEMLCTSLGRAIASKGLVLLSGEGRNVTTFVSEGAFNFLIDDGQDYSNLIRLYRIPRFARDHANQRYRLKYRQALTDNARVAVVIAGRDGTLEEVSLCAERQIPIVPIKWTGGTAERAWLRVANAELAYARALLSDDDLTFLATRPRDNEVGGYVQQLVNLVVRLLGSGTAGH